MLRTVLAFVRLGRPLFLGGGFLLYAIGAVLALAGGHALELRRYVLGQAAVTAFQLMTHYANDYFDYAADRANLTPTSWSGGSRVLVGGELPRATALVAALVLAAIGLGVSGSLIAITGEPYIAVTLALIGTLAWCYSAPPVRLCASGLGELDTAIVVTGLVPWLGFALQAADLRGGGLLVPTLAPLALLQIAMLLAIEFPDAAGDAATGKRTLVVRLGAARATQLYSALTSLAFVAIVGGHMIGVPTRVTLAASALVPLAAWRVGRARRDTVDPAAWERLTLGAVALLVGTSAATLAAWLSLAV